MGQQIFNIQHEEVPNDCLIVELSSTQVSFISLAENGVFGKNIEVYTLYPTKPFKDQLENIIQNATIPNIDFNTVHIVWENSLAQCIPTSLANESLLNAAYTILGNETQQVMEQSCSNRNITVSYLVHKEHWDAIETIFPTATHQHKYLPITDHFCNYTSDKALNILVLFLQGHFIITAQKEQQLQFINTIDYTSGTEAVYHILNTAKQLNTNINDTNVVLSGLIDGDSPLFREIYQYIPFIDVDKSEKATFLKEDFSSYPSHYFVPFFKYV